MSGLMKKPVVTGGIPRGTVEGWIENFDILPLNLQIDGGLMMTLEWVVSFSEKSNITAFMRGLDSINTSVFSFGRKGRTEKFFLSLTRKDREKIRAAAAKLDDIRQLEDLLQERRAAMEKSKKEASRLWREYLDAEKEEKERLKKKHEQAKLEENKAKEKVRQTYMFLSDGEEAFDFLFPFYQKVLLANYKPVKLVALGNGEEVLVLEARGEKNVSSFSMKSFRSFFATFLEDFKNVPRNESESWDFIDFAEESLQKLSPQEVYFTEPHPVLKKFGLYRDEAIEIDASIEIKTMLEPPLAPTTSSLASSMIASGILGDISVEDEDEDEGRFIAKTSLVQVTKMSERITPEGETVSTEIVTWDKFLGVYLLEKREFKLLK